MKTLFERDRPSLTRNQWTRRKQLYRRAGLKEGEWYTISLEGLTNGTVRIGLNIRTKSKKTKSRQIYTVIDVKGKLVSVLPIGEKAKRDGSNIKMIKAIHLYEWVPSVSI